MDSMDTDKLVQQLAAGFDALQVEYQKLFGQHESLQRKLATAREQYNELAKLCGASTVATPPLSLASSPPFAGAEITDVVSAADLLERRQGSTPKDAARQVRAAVLAAQTLHRTRTGTAPASGVRIWSGPAADRPDHASSMMPSISESPLEQDFTIEGVPSKLGCPFASMANKKLSSHAASVLSRYNTRDSVGVPGSLISGVSRVNGKESMLRRESRRASFADPIKAEICGLSDHRPDAESPHSERALKHHVESQENAEAGVCPIRFLDQHSPEEVATYFEKHKHEIPRSHEVCVRRYQSNEQQIRELDAKYGNLVSMIQGLGAKHKEMLPDEPDHENDTAAEQVEQTGKGAEQVRKWASSVSVLAVDGHDEVEAPREERQPHFERPLRDIRVGESPSRPWGIHVPAKYLDNEGSQASSRPAQVTSPAHLSPEPAKEQQQSGKHEGAAAPRCPFGFDKGVPAPEVVTKPAELASDEPRAPRSKMEPVFIAPAPETRPSGNMDEALKQPSMTFTGPVFFGYSAEDAAKILRQGGFADT